MKRLIRSRWLNITTWHPGMESLIAYGDGKPSPEVRKHLERCPRCRQTAGFLQNAIQPAPEGDGSQERTAVLLRETYEILRIRMASWHSVAECMPAAHVHSKQGRPRRLLQALEFYFGEELARRVDRGAGSDTADHLLVSSTKPFFAAFLGRMAAEALAQELAGAAT